MATPNLDAFQVIADPSRRQILQMLTRDSYNINSISEHFDMSRPAVSKHIKILETAGFVTIQIVGREHLHEEFRKMKVYRKVTFSFKQLISRV